MADNVVFNPMKLATRLRSVAKRILRSILQDVVNDIRLNSFLVFGPRERLKLHPSAQVQNALFNVVSGTITIDEYAFFGHNVSLLTGRHDVEKYDRERQECVPTEGNNIIVRRGVWIASNAVIIGPCEIGENAVVAAGSIVIRDVPPGAIVAGNPAKAIRNSVVPS